MTNSMPNPSARKLAYQALYDVLEKGAYANITLQHILKTYPLINEEVHLLTELTYGVLRRYNYLIWIISRISKVTVNKLHPSVRILICLGLYQLIYLTRIPESAAVNECVKIAKKVTHRGNVGFINGILRNYLRKKEEIVMPGRENAPLLHDSLYWNEPEWLVQRWQKEFGKDLTTRIFDSFNEIPRFVIRVNTLKITADQMIEKLEASHIAVQKSPFADDALVITDGIHNIWKFVAEGLGYVQSISSMIPARVLDPQPGERILDMCAAPGSKTTQLAALMKNKGSIDAWDLYPHKISLLKKNAEKLGITIIHAGARDSSLPFPALKGVYDKVLLDAPCSGLGVLGHKLEIRWRRTAEGLDDFPPLQRKLLDCAADYVKRGGVLVYSTCTLNSSENEGQISDFLKRHPDFHPSDFTLQGYRHSRNGMVTLLPFEMNSDGFFIARLEKE